MEISEKNVTLYISKDDIELEIAKKKTYLSDAYPPIRIRFPRKFRAACSIAVFPRIGVTKENCCWCGSSGEGWKKRGWMAPGALHPPSEIKTLIRPDNIQLTGLTWILISSLYSCLSCSNAGPLSPSLSLSLPIFDHRRNLMLRFRY